MIVFVVNGKEYAISVTQVKSIEKWQNQRECLASNHIFAG